MSRVVKYPRVRHVRYIGVYTEDLTGLSQSIPATAYNFTELYSIVVRVKATGQHVEISIKETPTSILIESNLDMTGLEVVIKGV